MGRTLRKRLLPALLALVMVLSLLPAAAPTAQAADAVSGSISATVRIDYDQSLEELQSRSLQAELLRNGASLGSIDLTSSGQQSLSGGYTAHVSLRDQSGGEMTGEWPGYLDFSVEGLPQGAYTLRFTGKGYVSYEETVYMTDYARHLIVGTGDATFTLGDVNGDGRVDGEDLERLSGALGSELRQDLAVYDLSGDGVIDVVDLAYVNRMVKAAGGSEALETVLLVPPVDTALLADQLTRQGVVVADGDLSDLFVRNGETVTFRPNADGLIVLPLEFRQAVELEELRVYSPEYAAPLAGTVAVEDEAGNVFTYSFDNTVPAGVRTLSAQEDSSVITIDLGRRVAVKKVTVTVTKTANGYATVEAIEFLKDMIPADPSAANSQVTGLTAVEGDEKVTLTWNSLPNISGYQVNWWPVDDPSKAQRRYTETTRLEISGLENLTAYQFTVTAVDGTWSGKPSNPVTATPQPVKAPAAPDMVNVTALDGALGVSWKESKSATWYEVYYTDVPNAPSASYVRWGEVLAGTSTTITGLTNGTAYYIYIIAGNEMGRSGPSRISTGTPKAVVYERPAGIPTEGVLDYRDFQSIRLADPGNYSVTECPGFDPWHMADGDYRTQWTVRNWSGNEHVVVTFKEPQNLAAAIWIPRMDGSYAANLRAYSVLVWLEGDELDGPGRHITAGVDNNTHTGGSDVWTWPAIRGNPASAGFAVMPFPPQEKVVRISVAAEQRDYTLTNLCELMFLKYDENHRLPDDIAGLFADDLHTTLASDVTRERISQLRARLNSDEQNYYMDIQTLADELDLAQELLTGQTGTSVILNGIDSRSGGNDSKNHGQSASALQPLGVAAGANSEITIYAQGIPEGGTVTVWATQFNAEVSAWQASMGTLENGRNILTVPKIGSQNTARGGSLYLTYSGANAENIRLHVRRGTVIPTLDLSDWNGMSAAARTQAVSDYINALDGYLARNPIGSDQTDWRNVTEIATPSVLLSLPAKAVQSGLKSSDRTAQLLNSVAAWEELLQICRTVQGITGTMETRQNIRCMQMFTGAFMYAAGNHVGIGYGSCSGMVSGAPVANMAGGASANSLFGWGIAHEIGHNMDKLGKAEITNNIYSLAAQTYDGKQNTLTSRLESSGKYAAIFNKVAQGYPGASNDVFVQLGMYWQLHLAYDGGEAPLDFYTRFFTAWKAGTYFNGASSYDDKVALTASGVVGKNLTEFFTRWGMTLSAETKAALSGYEPETRAIWYLNDQSRRDRLAGVSAASGSVTATAVRSGDNQVVLTIHPAVTGKVQGYEIRRGNMTIAFTTDTTYTDTIGTGNNRIYQYTVTAYDTLGNQIGSAATTNEVRIAYDLTLDPESYTVTQDGGSIRFSMTKPAAVTGLKLPAGTDLSGLTVSIEENGKTAVVGNTRDTARTDSAITYFQRPGADATQATQVWTYQAMSVTISGLPSTVTAEDVALISYMGDDIAFLNGPTVGVMARDYHYGSGADDVIKQGSLVITGTYRGDPVYNTVRIKGDFSAPDMAEANGDQGPQNAGQDVRDINGTAILFASESSDMTYTNISDGVFIFIPNVQAEAELQEGAVSCGAASVLPSRIRAELWRTDTPDSAEGTRMTAQTLWINSPGGTDLPLVEVKGDLS